MVLAVLLAGLFLVTGTGKVIAVSSMRERAAHVGFSVDAYRRIGALELLGAIGLLAGFAEPAIGVAAATGILLLMLGAIAAHARSKDTLGAMAPAVIVLALDIAFLAIRLAS
jgi:hypothetical protein